MTDFPNVLLVDDRPENLLALSAVLEPLNCRTVSVTSGDEALKALLQEEFAVVLLDVQMPGMDGFETAELIKQRERTSALPIIFVTAINTEPHHVFRGYSAGAVDYIFKPYDPSILRSKVAVFLELDARTRGEARSRAMLRAAFDYAPIGMVRLDMDGRIAEANRTFGALLGYDPAALRDRLLDVLIHPDDADSDRDRRRSLFDGGLARYEHEARLVTAGGDPIPCALSFSLAKPGGAVPDAVVLQVQDLQERRRAEEERSQRIAEQAARAQAERMLARLGAIQRISDAALGTLAVDDLLAEVLHRTVDALSADTAAIAVYESDERTLVYQIAGGVDAKMQSWAVGGLEGHPLGDAVATALEQPLVADGAPIGMLYIGTLFKRQFSEEERALLSLAADRAALGIQRARLFQREHAIAEELQRSLLPPGLPEVEGVSAAAFYSAAGSQVGGDWYDMVVQPDGRLLMVIGDVAGRGLPAASTMGQLRSALRAYAVDGHSPASLLGRLNAFQLGLRNRGMTTLFVVSVDPRTGSASYAKAGHPPALVVTPEGKPLWLDDVTGVPLGAIDDPTYEERTVELAPGSTLVLFTDGLVELRGEPLDRGFERLQAAVISAPDDVDSLCEWLLTRTLTDHVVDDDVTLLVLRTAGPRRWPQYHHRDDAANGRFAADATIVLEQTFTGGPQAGSAVRHALAGELQDAVTEEQLTDLRIMVAEVVNNAVLHGGAGGDEELAVRVAAAPGSLRVEVTAPGEAFEATPLRALDEPGGFGLLIVDQLSTRWGVEPGDGVCVWFEFDL